MRPHMRVWSPITQNFPGCGYRAGGVLIMVLVSCLLIRCWVQHSLSSVTFVDFSCARLGRFLLDVSL